MSNPEISYEAVSVRLRAARVAVVIPALKNWTIPAYVALKQCAATWGGAGFLLVPHRDGEVDGLFLRLAAAYDPDHIVSVSLSPADLDRLLPGQYQFTGEKGRPLGREDLESLGASISNHLPLSQHDERAIQAVARSCAPFRDPNRDDGSPDIDLVIRRLPLVEPDSKGPFRYHRDLVPATDTPPTYSTTNDAADTARLWLLSVLGMELDDLPAATSDLAMLMTEQLRTSPEYRGMGPAWSASMQGLTQLTRFRQSFHWLVVGDTVEDFALHHALSRMDLSSMWLPRRWLDPSNEPSKVARATVTRLRSSSFQEEVRLTSFSVPLSEELQSELSSLQYVLTDRREDWMTPVETSKLPKEVDRRFLALEGNFDRELIIPVVPTTAGDRLLLNRLPPLLPEPAGVSESPSTSWVTDIEIHGHNLPPGRSLTPKDLQAEGDPWLERVRLGRDGISVMSQSWGLVLAGSTPRQSVARPRLRIPSLLTEVTSDGRQAGYEVAISDAGFRAKLACALWVSRRSMADDLYKNISYFRTFLSSKRTTTERYPDDDGCVLTNDGPEGFPTFQALCRALPTLDSSDVRELVDKHIEQGILHRGLIVKCPECTKGQFTTPQAADFSSDCRRCGVRIPLIRETWRQPEDEPRWYYSLNPRVRQLLKENGDVPLLAEAYMTQKVNRELHGVPELDLKREKGTTIEIDILAATHESVLVGEAKSSPASKDLKKKTSGLLDAAGILSANEVVLAAGNEGDWPESVVSHLGTQILSRAWPVRGIPAIRIVTGLRTDKPKMQLIEPK